MPAGMWKVLAVPMLSPRWPALGRLRLRTGSGSHFTFLERRVTDPEAPQAAASSVPVRRRLEGQIVSIAIEPATVPEAPTGLLLAAGLSALGWMRRARRRAAPPLS